MLRHRVWFIAILMSAGLLIGMPALAGKTKPPRKKPLTAAQAQCKLDQYWQRARVEVDRGVLEILAQHQTELQRGLRYSKLIRGDATTKEIALTFDDGPHPQFTPQLLAVLRRYDVKATFFLVGEMAEKSPELVKDEVAAGHVIGNHTYHHVNLTKIPIADIATEIKACGEVLTSITGKTPDLFRPPGGDYDKEVALVSAAEGYMMVLWTDDPGDYASPGPQVILERTLDQVSNGGIILIHDGIQQTVDILPKLIAYLKAKGFTFVTINEMMNRKSPTAREGGVHH